MPYELESDLHQTMVWGRKWTVNFNVRKTQLASFDCHLTGAIDVKMDGSILDKRSSFRMLGLLFSLSSSYAVSIATIFATKLDSLNIYEVPFF